MNGPEIRETRDRSLHLRSPDTMKFTSSVLAGRALFALAALAGAAFPVCCVVLLLFWWLLIPVWMLLESAVWPILFINKFRRLNQQPKEHMPHPSGERIGCEVQTCGHACISNPSAAGYNPREAFDHFVNEAKNISKYVCIKDMVSKWFGDVPFSGTYAVRYDEGERASPLSHSSFSCVTEVKRGNVADLMTYGFWYKSREQLEAEGQGHLPDQVRLFSPLVLSFSSASPSSLKLVTQGERVSLPSRPYFPAPSQSTAGGGARTSLQR